MKKIIILLLLLMIPTLVNAETNYLYDVLKNEAENNGLAREYTGEHHDSFTIEPSKKIYHWYAETDEEGNQVLEKNNVIFGNICWQMIRTTDTGGVKLIYNGIPNEGKCTATGQGQQIAKSEFNSNQYSASDVGYMFNKKYDQNLKKVIFTENVLSATTADTNDWYADSAIWNTTTNKWELVNPYRLNGSNNRDWIGKYTLDSGEEDYTSENLYYIVAVNSSTIFCVKLTEGHDISYYNDTYTYGDSYTDNGDGTYTINSPTTLNHSNYYSDYLHNHQSNKYLCKNAVNNTCSDLWYMYNEYSTFFNYAKVSQNYKYANSFSYDNSTNKYTLNNDSVTIWNMNNSNISYLNDHHYTCWNESGICNELSYIYYYDSEGIFYINLENGNGVEEAINEMLRSDNININNSSIKTLIDTWYQNNLTNYTNKIEDTIYCNNREINNLASSGWNPNGGNISTMIQFGNNDLSCPQDRDKFSTNNKKAKLIYPIGLMTRNELNLVYNVNIKKTGEYYWLMNPDFFSKYGAYLNAIGDSGYYSSYYNTGQIGVRPAISLKPKIKYISGNGSDTEPYIIDLSNNYSIDVEINNETEDLTVEIDDLSQVPSGETVNFKVTPIKGHKVTSIRIVDENNNEIEYTTTDNKNYTFTMPATDVIIIPSFERVKNAVNVEDNKNTKEFVIEVNDSQAVVYEDTVRFKVEPEVGYEVEKIEITDEEQNNINYRKTNNINEYEFIMPDTNVLIKPFYRLIPINGNISNPNTKRQILLIVISVIILTIMTFIYIKKKKRLT